MEAFNQICFDFPRRHLYIKERINILQLFHGERQVSLALLQCFQALKVSGFNNAEKSRSNYALPMLDNQI